MSRWTILVALVLLAGCAREVDLGAVANTTQGTTAGGSCRRDSDCGGGQQCLAGVCTVVASSCDPLQACATPDGTFCAGSCPTCTSGDRCCMDNGFGQCQCFCGLSCSGPSCAPAGVDSGPQGASCSGDADCLCGETCSGGTCRAGPVTVTCASGFDCQTYGCGNDSCVNGRCVPPGWSCVNDRECGVVGSGEGCVSGVCQCVSHAGRACADASACSACAGERCQQGFCSVFTTSGGATSGATAGNGGVTSGGATSGGTTSGGTTSSGGSISSTSGTGTVGGSSGSTFGTSSVGSGSTGSGGCACSSDSDCNDAYHVGYVCSTSGLCVPGPTSATLSSTGGVCAVAGSNGSTSTSGTGTSGSGSTSGSGGGFASSTSGTT